jgi:hypothetical protein
MAPEQLPELLGELEVIRATAQLRMSAPALVKSPDEQLDIGTAAKRLGVSKRYLYQHADDYAFTRREGRKLLFSGQGIDAYLHPKHSNNVLTARQHARILSLSSSR